MFYAAQDLQLYFPSGASMLSQCDVQYAVPWSVLMLLWGTARTTVTAKQGPARQVVQAKRCTYMGSGSTKIVINAAPMYVLFRFHVHIKCSEEL